MPLKARLRIAAWLALYLASCAALIGAAVAWAPQPWVAWLLAASLGVLTLLLLDAFHPRVSLFVPAVVRIPQQGDGGTIALTFDDGPVEPYTRQILDILDRYQVGASFFCIGENVARHPDLAREIVRRGHSLGNHTQNHRNLLTLGPDGIEREIRTAQRTVHQACGVEPRYFRCPKGYKSPFLRRVLRRNVLTPVAYGYPVWDVENPPPEDIVQRVLGRAAAGDVVVMHDGFRADRPGRRDSLVAALPRIIEGLLARGLRPVSLDRAFGHGR